MILIDICVGRGQVGAVWGAGLRFRRGSSTWLGFGGGWRLVQYSQHASWTAYLPAPTACLQPSPAQHTAHKAHLQEADGERGVRLRGDPQPEVLVDAVGLGQELLHLQAHTVGVRGKEMVQWAGIAE